MNLDQAYQEFDKQVENLIKKNYPTLAKLSVNEFKDLVFPLKEKLKEFSFQPIDIDSGTLPFVIVIKSSFVLAEKMMEKVEKDGKNGVTILRPLAALDFKELDEVEPPGVDIYLLVDIDRGKESLNIRPNDALLGIKEKGRSPLTIDEGIALVTHFPQFLVKNNCFSLLGSRTGKDKRVPAIWINSKKEPNLGWCWNGNPHTWLGSASCLIRVGV